MMKAKRICIISSIFLLLMIALGMFFNKNIFSKKNTNINKERVIYILVTNSKILGKGAVELYSALKKDNHKVKIVSIPFLSYEKNNKIAHHEEEGFLKNFSSDDVIRPCENIKNSNKCSDVDFNKEDIIFTQRPYLNEWLDTPTEKFNIQELSKKCKVAYIAYDSKIFHMTHVTTNLLNIVSLLFAENQVAADIFHKEYKIPKNNIIVTGFPEYNSLRKSNGLNDTTKEVFIWMPRWRVDFTYRKFYESGSTFLNYHNYFYNYLKNNPNIHMIMRPHFLLFSFIVHNKSLTQKELDYILERFKKLPNFELSNDNSLDEDIKRAKFVVADLTSSLAQVAIARLPIIYLSNGYDDVFNSTLLSKKLFKHIYLAKEPLQIEQHIETLQQNNYQVNGDISEYNEFLELLDPVENPSEKISQYLKTH